MSYGQFPNDPGLSGNATASGVSSKWLGLNGNSVAGFGGVTDWLQLGFVYDRLEWVQPASAVSAASSDGVSLAFSIANGFTPIVELEPAGYGGGAFPTGAAIAAYAAYVVQQIQSIEAKYYGLGILYECVNEPWNFFAGPPTPAQHADLVIAVLNACAAAKLDMTRIYIQTRDPAWLAAMYAQQPTLQTVCQGWAVHPYGSPPPGFAAGTMQGIAAVPNLRAGIKSGANNILISEIGHRDFTISGTGGTSEDTALTAAQIVRYWQRTLRLGQAYHNFGWLKALVIYSRNDTEWAMNAAGGALTNAGTQVQRYGEPAPDFTTGTYSVDDDAVAAVTMVPEAAADNGPQLVAGRLLLFRVRIDRRQFAQRFIYSVGTVGVTLTAGQNLFGIYDETGLLWDTSADQAANFAALGRHEATFPGGDNYKPGNWWLGILGNGATMPKLWGSLAGFLNLGNGGATRNRAMQSTAAGLTALPATVNLDTGFTVFTGGLPLVALAA